MDYEKTPIQTKFRCKLYILSNIHEIAARHCLFKVYGSNEYDTF